MNKFLDSVRFANAGITYFFRNEKNGRIQIVVAAIAIAVGIVLKIAVLEWCIILICIALVIGLEMMNTAIEHLCKMLSEDYHPTIKIIKDVAAGAVWWVSIISFIIGVVIFVPYLLFMLK